MSPNGEHAAGRVLNDRYELIEKIGEGGMAVTYRAKDRLLDREVAVKCMREQFAAAPEFAERFRQEARAAANLSHPHIASVYDTGSSDGCHYLVMEFIEGEDLKQQVRRSGPLEAKAALDIARQVAEALDAAHSRGIVHRDIKPQNILVTAADEVKVTDFGIARAMYAPGDGETDTIIGSAHYFAPEQARGEAAGPPADVYALGCVLFQMLTGRPPFEGENPVAVAHMQIYDPPPRPRTFNPEVPPAVERIVMKCLEKDPGRRYASARELARELVAAGEQAVEIPRPEPAAPVARPAPEAVPPAGGTHWGWVVAVIVVLLGGAAGIWYLVHLPSEGEPNVVRVPEVVNMSRDSAARLLRGPEFGLEFEVVGTEYSDTVAPEYVVRQDPRPGARLQQGQPVRVWLSKGSFLKSVPSLAEMSVGRARKELEASGFKVGQTIEVYDEDVPVGYVVGTSPPAGEDWRPGLAVNLRVSKGPEPPPPPAPLVSDRFSYTVPNDYPKDKVTVTIQMEDDTGEQVLYEDIHAPGDAIRDLAFEHRGEATVRVYLDGALARERRFGVPPEEEAP